MENEFIIRLGVFLGLFVLLATVERIVPRRVLVTHKARRWLTNWAISFVNTFTLRIMAITLPLLAMGAAMDASNLGWGVFNMLQLPFWFELLLTILLLDFSIWLQHVLTHKIPVLWRLHRVHHADRDLDVTTAIRFHPVEIALSMLLKIGLVYLLGASALAILIFEVLLNATAMFSHANIKLSARVDRVLRRVIVTPDMHRVHHSVDREEHDSNYGFALSIWDRIFRTYRDQPKDGHTEMVLGLQWQDEKPNQIGWALLLPFRKK